MAKFKVGDKVRLVYARTSFTECWKKGIEVSIVAISEGYIGAGRYECIVSLGEYRVGVLFKQLEPTTELGSWKEIEDSIGWSPMKKVECID